MNIGVQFSLSPFMKDMVITTITSIITIVCLILTIKVIANGVGPDEFGAYSLARRILTVADPIATFAMGFALTRYTAISLDDHKGHSYLSSATLIVFVITTLIIALGIWFDVRISEIIFNDSNHTSLFHATLVLVAGYSMYILLYSHLRGLGLMSIANIWQLAVVAIGPLIISWQVLDAGGGVELIIYGMAALFFLSAPFIVKYLKIYTLLDGRFFRKNKLKELVVYAMPRVPGIFSYNLMFAVGPFIAAYHGLLRESGFIVIGQFVLRIVEGGLESFSRVAFPRLAQDFSKSGKEGVTKSVSNLVAMIFHIGFYVTVHLLVWNDVIITSWLGVEYIDALIPMQIITLAILPYLFFVIMRNVLDAVEVKSIVANYLHVALLITIFFSLLSMWIDLSVNGLAISFITGIFFMGLMTLRRIYNDFSVDKGSLYFLKIISLNALILVVLFLVKIGYEFSIMEPVTMLPLLLMEVLFFTLYIYYINKMECSWIQMILNRLIKEERV
jgi:O-antigen/teichoic acid export membrane protein